MATASSDTLRNGSLRLALVRAGTGGDRAGPVHQGSGQCSPGVRAARAVFSWFNLTLQHNSGAAFSFLSDAGGWQRYFFSAVAVVISACWWSGCTACPRAVAAGAALGLILGVPWVTCGTGWRWAMWWILFPCIIGLVFPGFQYRRFGDHRGRRACCWTVFPVAAGVKTVRRRGRGGMT